MRVGFYGSTPSYWPVFEQHGWEDLGHKLNDMSKKGQWEQMTQEVSDDIVMSSALSDALIRSQIKFVKDLRAAST
jgi:hypothetical protein